jgi:hypothetical protein
MPNTSKQAAEPRDPGRSRRRASEEITVGCCIIKRQHLRTLKDAWARGRLVLFLGAGLSVPYGLSNWNDLVLDMLLNSEEDFDRFWPNYRKALGAWMAGCYDFSATTLARVVKARKEADCGDISDLDRQRYFTKFVRQALYRTFRQPAQEPPAMGAVTEMIRRSEQAVGGRRIPVVLTTNFDDLLEAELRRKGVTALPVYNDSRRRGDKLPVIHVHGYLPRRGDIPTCELVFTEDEYHRISYSFFHWSLADIVNCFRNYTVLFVGHSLSDPNLRRLLDATRNADEPVSHFLVRPQYRIPDDDRMNVIERVEQSAREHARRMNVNFIKTPTQLDSAMNEMLKQARSYEDDLFADMGVGVLWISNYEDIRPLLSEVSR